MWESRVLQRAFERLELHEGKLSRAVLRGGGGGDVTSLPDAGVGNHPGLPGPRAPYSVSRAGAVAKLRLRDFQHDGTQYVVRFLEKGSKSRKIPSGMILKSISARILIGLESRPRIRIVRCFVRRWEGPNG